MKEFTAIIFALSVSFLPIHHASAVETLSASELASHCSEYPKESTSLDGEFCARYIQGFIDGAVATDARVMLSVEADLKEKKSFKERALKTRLPGRGDYLRAAQYAGFCLGDPVPLKEVVEKIAFDLQQQKDLTETTAAREFVYGSLQEHYPCEPE